MPESTSSVCSRTSKYKKKVRQLQKFQIFEVSTVFVVFQKILEFARQLGFKRRLISDFKSKEDIIDCCMASVHIPLFMNGYPWTRYDGKRVIDGSILTKRYKT